MTSMLVPLTILGLALPPWTPSSRSWAAPRLSEKDGPFMVAASLFEGADAEGLAQSLAREFRDEHKIPSRVLGYRYQGRE